MSTNFTRDHLKISVVKILHTLGWNSINSTPLEILTEILGSYMLQICKTANNYANEFGQIVPNLDHLGLTFRDMGIGVGELEEYVRYVNFGPPPHPVPRYPIPKEDHLNFLKPGSKEVITRPLHIHEHLPPMNPLLEGGDGESDGICKIEAADDANDVFKKPSDLPLPRPSIRREEEGSRPTREISSVMMTTSGFLSPAREGKLPEARTPAAALESMGPLEPAQNEPLDLKKPPRPAKRVEKRRERERPAAKEAAARPGEDRGRRAPPPRAAARGGRPPRTQSAGGGGGGSGATKDAARAAPAHHPAPCTITKPNQNSKINKALAAARLKTEKFNTTITPITIKPSTSTNQPTTNVENVDKLLTEPDKKKVNIFKKISNVKNEKAADNKKKEDVVKPKSAESSPDLVIDEPDEIVSKLSNLPSDVTIEPIHLPVKSPEKAEVPFFDDDSQPGTPSTPKTPEMLTHSPPMVKEKRKRKESKRQRKVPRMQSPSRIDNDVDVDMERPKTPETSISKMDKMNLPLPLPNHQMGPLPHIPFSFLTNFGGPGLIPTNPLFAPLPFPPINLHNFGQKPYMSPAGSSAPLANSSSSPPEKLDESDARSSTSDKPASVASEAEVSSSTKADKKNKEHKKEKKDKVKKKNKKDKIKNKAEKKKLKEEKKEKNKKEKKEKKKEKDSLKDETSQSVKITLKLKSPSPRPNTPETRKLNIKPIVKKENDESNGNDDRQRETSPGLAKISALVTGPPKPSKNSNSSAFNDNIPSSSSDNFVNHMKKSMFKAIPKIRTKEIRRDYEVPLLQPAPPSKYIDADGNEVWICPACGRQDDGSPMIGCDGCDAWYHWVCVGIQVPPDDNEDWYCRHCLSKKNEDLQTDKQKKKRKKREKKEH